VTSGDRGGDVIVRMLADKPVALALTPKGVSWHHESNGVKQKFVVLSDSNDYFREGVVIGDIRGCFKYHGFVNFRVQVMAEP
jgi:hypothetical protein